MIRTRPDREVMTPTTRRMQATNPHNDMHQQQQGRRPIIRASLDLHGYRKPEAIRRLTDFLEAVSKKKSSSTCWVSVVTGSGAHSQNGPVLRTAVEALLTKRKMVFTLENKGSFIVNAKSGIVLYNPEPATDSKLSILPHDENRDLKLVGRAAPQQTVAAAIISDQQQQEKQLYHQYLMQHPIPRQVAQDDSLLERIKHQSRRELQTRANEMSKINKAMKRVMSESQLEFERDSMLRTNEDEKLQQALLQSEHHVSEADALLQEVLAKSAQDLAQQQEEEDRQLQEILAQSAQDVVSQNLAKQQEEEDRQLQEILAQSARDLAKQQEEEERELQAILAKSMEDVVTVLQEDDDKIPPQSLPMDEQDELLIQAMEQSLREG